MDEVAALHKARVAPVTTLARKPCSTRRKLLLATAACLGGFGLPARALPTPTGEAVLTISGRLRKPNQGTQAVFDMAMLESLAQTTLVAKTPWYSEQRSFTGPLLRDLLARCDAQGEALRLSALNDFRADMPMADVLKHDVIVARLLDGKPMSVRDRGPLFVMYPFNAKPELRSVVHYSRSVWQLRWIEVL